MRLDAAMVCDDGYAVLFLAPPLLGIAILAQDAGEPPPVDRNPEVGESRHDISPPLRDIPPAKRRKGHRVHPVKPLPRPKPPPDGGQE
ncbi:MAG TPA: hypothetical protein VI356_04045 [Myxococcales bacterium]